MADIREARELYPATDSLAYFNTAALGLASRALSLALQRYIDEWSTTGPRFAAGSELALRQSP